MVSKYQAVNAWYRPSEIVGKESKPSLWGSLGVLPNGINQGQLGDCWFLASAAAIAENPKRIKDMFYNEEYSAEGVFSITFYMKGLPVQITIDDTLPIIEGKDPKYTDFGKKTPVNARPSNNGAWWVPLLEKAYAKFN